MTTRRTSVQTRAARTRARIPPAIARIAASVTEAPTDGSNHFRSLGAFVSPRIDVTSRHDSTRHARTSMIQVDNNEPLISRSAAARLRTNAVRPKLRLFCLAQAGCDAGCFHPWQDRLLPHDVEVLPIELPGRGQRFKETPATSRPSAPSCSARSSRRYQSSSRVKTTTSSRAGAARKRSKNTTSG